MEKMKAISWDKLRRLVGRKKSKDRDTDSSRFQRSYSFKRASVRKSGRRTTVVVSGGGAAISSGAAVASNGSCGGASSSSSSNENNNGYNGYCASATTTDLLSSSSAAISRHQHEPFQKSNGQMSDGCSNNNSTDKNQLTKAGYQEVTVNVDVIADGKNILKQEQVFELKLGNRQSDSDVKVAVAPTSYVKQQQKIVYKEEKYGSRTNLFHISNSQNGKHSSKVSIVSPSADTVIDRYNSRLSPVPPVQTQGSGARSSSGEDVLLRDHDGHRVMNQRRGCSVENNGATSEMRDISEMDDDDDDEVVMNKWLLMRNQGGHMMGRRQRAENIYRMMSAEDDSDSFLDEEVARVAGAGDHDDSPGKLGARRLLSRNSRFAPGNKNRELSPQQPPSRSEAEGEIFEDEFYLAMLAESPRPLRRSTDSALSRLTSDDSNNSRSRSRLDDNLDYRATGIHMKHAGSSIDLIQESKQNNPQRRRQLSPSALASPTPPPHHHQLLNNNLFNPAQRPPSSCAQNHTSINLNGSSSNINMIPDGGGGFRKNRELKVKRDIHKSTDDLVADKHSPDSGSYHYGSSSKLSESKHGSGSSVLGSRDDLDSKDISPSPEIQLSPRHHLHNQHHHHHLQEHDHHLHHHHHSQVNSTSSEMLLSRQPPYLASTSSNRGPGTAEVDDSGSSPRSFWWTQKAGSTMTTSSGASKDSGFSLGRSWAMGLAHKVFGKRGASKGPILSVSKEGYFQRTNLRRSGKRPAYPIHLRSSVTRRSSSRKRRSGRAARRANNLNHGNNTAVSAQNSADAGNSSSCSASNKNNQRVSCNNAMMPSSSASLSQSSPSSPDPVKSSESLEDIIILDDEDSETVVVTHSHDSQFEEMENEIISKTNKLVINTSENGSYVCSSPNYYQQQHHNNIMSSPLHDESIFEEGDEEESSSVNIYQAHAAMSHRHRMLLRQQHHQQFVVFATPHSAEPLIFVPPERRKSSGISSSCSASSSSPTKRKPGKTSYSKTVFEIRNHLPGAVAGVGPKMQEPVELLRLPRLKCAEKKSSRDEKSVLITKVSGPYDNEGRMSRASCGSGASGSGGVCMISNSVLDRDCNSRLGYYNNGTKFVDCSDRLSPPCINNSNNININGNNVGRRTSQSSHLQSPHLLTSESDLLDNGDRMESSYGHNHISRRDCKIRDRLPSTSLNDEEACHEEYVDNDDEYVDDDETDEMNDHHHHHHQRRQMKNNEVIVVDEDDAAAAVRRRGKIVFGDHQVPSYMLSANENESNSSRNRSRSRGAGTSHSHNEINNAIRRKQSTKRANNAHHHNSRPSKVITKPTAVAVYRRYSTLYRRAKLGPNFALPRPTIKIGDITQKGYEKKRSRILAPYIPKQALAPKSNEGSASPSTRAKRRQHRRLTRNESRYHSEVRQEAVQQALAAMQNRPKPSLPMPSKRTSVMGRAPDHSQHDSGDSSTDDDSVGNEEGDLDDQDSGTPPERDRGDRNSRTASDTPTQQVLIHSDSSSTGSARETPPMQRPPKLPERNRVSNGTPAVGLTYANLGNLPGGNLGWEERPVHPIEHRSNRDSDRSSTGSNMKPQTPSSDGQSYHHQQHGSNLQRNSRPEITDLVEAMHNLRTHGSQGSQPPDVTSTGQSRRVAPADRVNRFNQKRSQSSVDESSGTITGTGRWKVSAKIQQLLNTLKRPKRRPLPEFYEDDDIELEMAAKNKDPNAPKPEGSVMSPALGEQLVIPSGLPRNLEAAVQRYGSATFKAPVATVLDPNGKLTITLSYGKLLSRSHKIAFALLNKTGHKGESVVKTGDRVALVYPNNDPINFICAFYGCLFAGVVPVPIEVPLTRRDAGSQQIGFLLGSCSVQVALTSEACLKGLPKSAASGEVVAFKGWPKLTWFVTEHLGKAPKDWSPSPRVTDETPAYIEYTTDRDGSVMGVTMNRAAMLAHCRSLTTACNYTEGEVMVCVLDFKREVGLWHSILTSVFNGMHVIFIPYALMKVNPASWMQMITKYRASIAIVKSRDLHWGLLATRDHRDISLASLRLLLVSDGANPWSLSSCDQFLSVFQNKGLRPDAICPCASSSEALTVSLRRPGRAGVNATGRGVLSMQGLSYGVVRVDQENSLTSLTLQDCGQVMPGAVIVVVRCDGQPYLCKTDEVGEVCIHSSATGAQYWGLQGLTNHTFKVQPLQGDGTPVSDSEYVRSGLLGFLGPGGLVFVCGSRNGLMSVSGRKHNADDIIATVLAVEPMKFIYRGRIAVFSIKVLRDERICVIAEQRPDCSEEESFQWMSRVLQAVDSIHQAGIYCLVLVNPNCLPKTPLGGIHLSETKRRFLEGTLHPANVLLCPHTCVTNLPKPREIHSDVGPASVMVGNIVQGNRLASAQGRDLGVVDEESDTAKKYQFISEILKWRSTSTADHVIFTLLNSKGTVTMTMTCSQLHKRAERVACLLLERAKINTGDHVALVYPPGLDLIAAFYGCLYAGAVPVTVRPPHPQNLQTTLPTVRMITEVSKSVLILSTQNVIKLLRSKEASNVVDVKSWPLTLETDDLPKRKLASIYRAPTAEMIAYLDFSVSTTGMLAGIKMSHSAVTSLCRSMKLACELYPSRHVALCLDPYCGLGFALWCLSSVYSGHHSILIPPSEVEVNPSLWLSAVSQYKVRDTFCSYGVMELCTKGLGSSVGLLKQRGVNLACVRTCVVVAEERPRINLTNSFSKLFSALGLSPRAVSTSFGCRVNVGICLQGASSPEPSTVYVDLRSLRHDRVTLVERGSPHSLCLMESGKLLPGSKVIIANPDTKGQCGDSHLGEIWVQSPHNASGYFTIFGDESSYADHFNARLVTGNTGEVYARTGYLGFLRRTENVQADGELHDAVFVVGALDETIMLRGLRYHPIDIENSILRCHKKITECAVFTWTNLLVIVVELEGNENEALDVVPLVTNCVLEEHFLIVGVVVVVDPGVVPINSRGEKQRMHLRDGFLADQLDPIFVAYNM